MSRIRTKSYSIQYFSWFISLPYASFFCPWPGIRNIRKRMNQSGKYWIEKDLKFSYSRLQLLESWGTTRQTPLQTAAGKGIPGNLWIGDTRRAPVGEGYQEGILCCRLPSAIHHVFVPARAGVLYVVDYRCCAIPLFYAISILFFVCYVKRFLKNFLCNVILVYREYAIYKSKKISHIVAYFKSRYFFTYCSTASFRLSFQPEGDPESENV